MRNSEKSLGLLSVASSIGIQVGFILIEDPWTNSGLAAAKCVMHMSDATILAEADGIVVGESKVCPRIRRGITEKWSFARLSLVATH